MGVVGPGLEVAPVHREHIVLADAEVILGKVRPEAPDLLPPVGVPAMREDDDRVLRIEVGQGQGLLCAVNYLEVVRVLTEKSLFSFVSLEGCYLPCVEENVNFARVNILS